MTRSERYEIDSMAQDAIDEVTVIAEKVQEILDDLANLNAALGELVG